MKIKSILVFFALLFSNLVPFFADEPPSMVPGNLKDTLSIQDPVLFSEQYQNPLNQPSDYSSLGKKEKNAYIAVGLSLFPGLGHVYLDDYKTAAGLAGTFSLGLGLNLSHLGDQSLDITVAMDTWFYGIYASYRDTHLYNGEKNYRYQMPTDSFTDLCFAPLSPVILNKPEVWGGVLGALAAGILLHKLAYPDDAHVSCSLSATYPLSAFPVGIGEEAFFRGYVQSALIEHSNPAMGIASSSILFGLAHWDNAKALPKEYRWRYHAFSVPFISLFGSYFGWLAYKNNSLKESVAVHVWYDFWLFLGSYLASQANINTPPARFAITIPF
ncbi:MAG: CPBP family intramembrane metalloprotease [Simkaniaceae bacterium]|nr:CPBP family intramembrane metalloprotease [Simkaniaceae bacterium]